MDQFIPCICHAAILFHGEGLSAAGTVDIRFSKDRLHHIGRDAACFHGIGEDFAALAEAHLDEAEEELSILHLDCRSLTAADLEHRRRDLRARMKAVGGMSMTRSAVQSNCTASVKAP